MSAEALRFDLKRVVSALTVLTVLLALSGFVVFAVGQATDFPYESNAESFVISLNIFNLLLYSGFNAFRAPAERLLARLLREADKRQVAIAYRHEAPISLAVGSLLLA